MLLQHPGRNWPALNGIGTEFFHYGGFGGQLAAVIEVDLTGLFAFQTGHGQRLLTLFPGADADAEGTAGAIHYTGGDGKAMIGQAGHGQRGHSGGGCFGFRFGHGDGTDDGVGADQRAEIALDTVFRKPGGNFPRDTALFVLAGAQRQVAVQCSAQ